MQQSAVDNVYIINFCSGTAYDDQHSEKTRRKRGSIFFRKKKVKQFYPQLLRVSDENISWYIIVRFSCF